MTMEKYTTSRILGVYDHYPCSLFPPYIIGEWTLIRQFEFFGAKALFYIAIILNALTRFHNSAGEFGKLVEPNSFLEMT